MLLKQAADTLTKGNSCRQHFLVNLPASQHCGFFLLLQGPPAMFIQLAAGQPPIGLQGCYNRGRIRGIAQTNGQVTQPALVTNAANWRTFGMTQKGLLIPQIQLQQLTVLQPVTGAKIRLVTDPGKLVPRTHDLAVIAAKYPVTHQRPQRFRYHPFQLNGQIGNTASRIQLPGSRKGAGRADIQTSSTTATVFVGLRFIHRQWQIREDFTEKKIGAGAAVDQHCVFANPAQRGFFRQRPLQHRRTVNKGALAQAGIGSLTNPRGNRRQPLAYQLVVITADGITGDVRLVRGIQQLPHGGIIMVIIHTETDRPQAAGLQLRRIQAQRLMALHIVHFAVIMAGQPALVMLAVGIHINIGDANLLEAGIPPPLPDLFGKRCVYIRH